VGERFIDLLRHGEPLGGARFLGAQDDPLSALGWEQMHLATTRDRPAWGRIVSSPARRCVDPARALASRLGLPIEKRPAFRERGFGAWDGLAAHQIPSESLAAFWSDPVAFNPPGAEPFQAFRDRVLAGWHELLCDGAPHDLLVTHGGVIRVVLVEVLRMSLEAFLLIEVPYACRTRLRIPPPPWRPSLIFHGSF
jgi:broad specificity phosphatase PhoE